MERAQAEAARMNMKKSSSNYSMNCDSIDGNDHDDKERISIKSEFSGIDNRRRLSIVNASGKKVSHLVEASNPTPCCGQQGHCT